MNMDSIRAHLNELNAFVIYGFAAFFTLLVILNRSRQITLPRPLVLIGWYTVVMLAVSWLLFHLIYFFTHSPRDGGLVLIAGTLSFIPVYVCALIVLFMYPKKTTDA
jgi:hypothetical protein